MRQMPQMSRAAVARELRVTWRVLDHIVDRKVKMYLDGMGLSWLCHIRIDETSAKKHHRYITLVSSDFGENFLSGVKEYLPNAENVMDPFHLINLANKKPDADRASNQVNGEKLKSIRYSLLKDPKNLKREEREALSDVTHDNDVIATSYAMKESLRRMYTMPPELARDHLRRWVEWVKRSGSKAFKALAKAVKSLHRAFTIGRQASTSANLPALISPRPLMNSGKPSGHFLLGMMAAVFLSTMM